MKTLKVYVVDYEGRRYSRHAVVSFLPLLSTLIFDLISLFICLVVGSNFFIKWRKNYWIVIGSLIDVVVIWDLFLATYTRTNNSHLYHHHQVTLKAQISLILFPSLSIHPDHPSLPSPPNDIQCPHRVNVSSCWSANTGTSMCRGP